MQAREQIREALRGGTPVPSSPEGVLHVMASGGFLLTRVQGVLSTPGPILLSEALLEQ